MTNIIIIACVSILFFCKSLKYNYVSDDVPVFIKTRDKYKDNWLKRVWWQIEGSIKVTQKQDHAITLTLHTLTSIFVYIAFGMSAASFLAALLFCLNPANNQGSIWISGRGYVLPTLFLLMAASCPLIAPLCLYAATYFNAGFLAPVMFTFSPYPWFLLFLLPIWIIQSKRFKHNVKTKVKKEMFDADKIIHPRKFILFFKTFGYYLFLSLIPWRNTFYHSFMQSAAGNTIMQGRAYRPDRWFFFGLISFSYFMFYIFTHNNMVAFGLAWFVVTLSPFCNLFRISQEIAERYMYAPLPGLMFVLAHFLLQYPPLSAVFLTMYATKLWFYMDFYKDDYFLGEIACLNSPEAWYGWHVRAHKRWDTGAFKEALTLWVMAKLISPLEFKILFNIATALRLVKNIPESEKYLKMAMDNVPKGQENQAREIHKQFRAGKAAILL